MAAALLWAVCPAVACGGCGWVTPTKLTNCGPAASCGVRMCRAPAGTGGGGLEGTPQSTGLREQCGQVCRVQ